MVQLCSVLALSLTGFGLAVRLRVRGCPRRRGLGIAGRFRVGGFRLCAIITIIIGVAQVWPVVEYGKFSQDDVKLFSCLDPRRYILQYFGDLFPFATPFEIQIGHLATLVSLNPKVTQTHTHKEDDAVCLQVVRIEMMIVSFATLNILPLAFFWVSLVNPRLWAQYTGKSSFR